MNIYENVWIGAFIYRLGIFTATNNIVNLSTINLYQQTPADKILSDLISSVNYQFFIIEFKRKDTRKDTKEETKYNILMENLQQKKNFDLISNQCHFMSRNSQDCSNLEFFPYIEYPKTNKSTIRLEEFFSKLKKSDIGVNGDEFFKYITFLKNIYKNGKVDGSSASGIIIGYDKNNNLIFIPAENILDLIKLIVDEHNKSKKKKKEQPRTNLI